MQKTHRLQLKVPVCFFSSYSSFYVCVYIRIGRHTHARAHTHRRSYVNYSTIFLSSLLEIDRRLNGCHPFFVPEYPRVATDDRRDNYHYILIIYLCRCIVNLGADQRRRTSLFVCRKYHTPFQNSSA